MATSNPLDEILNSNVDQHALNAVLGNLENELASPTLRAQINASLNTPGNVNTQGNLLVSGSQTHANTHSVNSNIFSTNNTSINISNLNGSKNMIGNVPISHMNSVVTSVNSPRFLKTDSLVTLHNSVINSTHLHQNQMQNDGVVKTDISQLHNLAPQRINASGHPVISTQMHSSVHNSGSAIHNLANIASEQKPVVISNSGEVKQSDPKQVLVNVVNPNSVQRPQYVIKQDPKQLKSDLNPHVLQPAQIRVMTQPQPASPSLNVINNQNMLRTPFTASSTSVVMTKPVANPQTVTVVRPALSTTFSSVPNVVTNSPRLATHTINRAGIPRGAAGTAPVRIAPQQPALRSQGGGTIALPPGLQLPPGAVLMKNAEGNLVVVQGAQSGNQKGQQFRPGMPTSAPAPVPGMVTPRPIAQVALPQTVSRPALSHSVTPSAAMPPVAQPQTAPIAVAQAQAQVQQLKESVFDSMKKCKNFLQTLIKLASQSSNQNSKTVENVKQLIQLLIDAKIEPEAFTEKLQAILNSSPQPYLVPFLRKSLPMLRLYLIQNKTKIDGVRAPPYEVMLKHPVPGMVPSQTPPTTPQSHAASPHTATQVSNKPPIPPNIRSMTAEQLQMFVNQQKRLQQKQQQVQAPQTKALLTKTQGSTSASSSRSSTPSSKMSLGALATASAATPNKDTSKRKFDSSAIKDDDDINDVATMGGVNLSEENRNIMASTELLGTQLRSCKDESFLASQPLVSRINRIARKHGLDDCPVEVANIISHATQERIKNLLERLSVIAEHRLEIYKNDSRFERSNDPRSQLKFLEELDQLEKKRHSEAEREVLIRAAKSRSKNEDPEHLKLRERAKQMQQQELEVARQREANETALAAIGPRKKRKLEESASTPDGSGSSSSRANAGTRQRIKRVNLRDLMFLLEQERESNKSTLLYKSLLK